ncbi:MULTISPECIES: DinB family protein [Saccharibacillus]|uniref:DinB family protein n=1 Tax=Saccharibacillus TaxID=456492 RepID=UPI0012388670|nr:DinB family protein [Saccharibacillus sp. WB 17]MWJ32821.1 DinB family protein [Saccharibacillus sp. WB 17]
MGEREQRLQEYGQWIETMRALERKRESFWDRALGEGKWTLREMVAHIVEWDCHFYGNAVKKTAEGEATTLKRQNVDLFNAKASAAGLMLSGAELAARAVAVRELLMRTVGGMPEETYRRIAVQPDGLTFQPESFLRDSIRHDRHHLKQLGTLGRL